MSVVVTAALIGLGTGIVVGVVATIAARLLSRVGKTWLVWVSPSSQRVGVQGVRARGEYATTKNLAGNEIDVPLEGAYSYAYGGSRAFLVDLDAGHPFRVGPSAEPKTQAGDVVRISGERLASIRKGHRMRQISQASGLDLALLSKLGIAVAIIAGLTLLGVVGIFAKIGGG